MRLLGVITISLLLAMNALAQDYDATATAIIIGATQTAQFQANNGEPTPTPDNFQTTATALVLQATQTAEASTGNTAVPVTAESLDQFELTATALVNQITQTAQASTDSQSSSNDNDNTNTSDGALSITAIIVGALVAILTAIGGALGLTNNNKPNNNG